MNRPNYTPADIAALKSLPPCQLDLDSGAALQLFAALQLALRHPAFPPDTAQTIHSIALSLQQYLAVTPNISAICELGWKQFRDDLAPTPKP